MVSNGGSDQLEPTIISDMRISGTHVQRPSTSFTPINQKILSSDADPAQHINVAGQDTRNRDAESNLPEQLGARKRKRRASALIPARKVSIVSGSENPHSEYPGDIDHSGDDKQSTKRRRLKPKEKENEKIREDTSKQLPQYAVTKLTSNSTKWTTTDEMIRGSGSYGVAKTTLEKLAAFQHRDANSVAHEDAPQAQIQLNVTRAAQRPVERESYTPARWQSADFEAPSSFQPPGWFFEGQQTIYPIDFMNVEDTLEGNFIFNSSPTVHTNEEQISRCQTEAPAAEIEPKIQVVLSPNVDITVSARPLVASEFEFGSEDMQYLELDDERFMNQVTSVSDRVIPNSPPPLLYSSQVKDAEPWETTSFVEDENGMFSRDWDDIYEPEEEVLEQTEDTNLDEVLVREEEDYPLDDLEEDDFVQLFSLHVGYQEATSATKLQSIPADYVHFNQAPGQSPDIQVNPPFDRNGYYLETEKEHVRDGAPATNEIQFRPQPERRLSIADDGIPGRISSDTSSSYGPTDEYAPLQPFARPAFPSRVRDRSPILGVSASLLLQTCFRIGEALRVSTSCDKSRQDVIIELFARVVSSFREPKSTRQYFELGDLFHDRPPYPRGVLENYKVYALQETESRVLLESSGSKHMVRCLGRLRRDVKYDNWLFDIINIRPTDWEEISWTKSIAGAGMVKPSQRTDELTI